jgi:hypothetical protein
MAFLQMKDHISTYTKHVMLYSTDNKPKTHGRGHSLGSPSPIFLLYGNNSIISIWQIVQVLFHYKLQNYDSTMSFSNNVRCTVRPSKWVGEAQ